MLAALLLLQAVATPPARPVDPVQAGNAVLKKSIVDAIRNCPASADGTVAVCSRDRGWAESEGRRLQKLKKPVGPPSTPAVTVQVTGGGADGCTDPRGCRRMDDEDRIDAETRARITRRRGE